MGPIPTSKENSIRQSKYFEEDELNLVVEFLCQDMMVENVSVVVKHQRPFKLFIASLDK
jgi:hypothetical protein